MSTERDLGGSDPQADAMIFIERMQLGYTDATKILASVAYSGPLLR